VKVQDLLMKSLSVVAVGAFALAVSVPAHAGTIWTTWNWDTPGNTGGAKGTLNGGEVWYNGETASSMLSIQYGPTIGATYPGDNGNGFWNGPINSSNDSFTGYVAGTYSGGVCISCTYTETPGLTAPPTSYDSVPIVGGYGGTETIAFDAAQNVPTTVTDPMIAIWSLGNVSGDTPGVFIFNEPFILVAGGPDAQYGGSALQVCTGTTATAPYTGTGCKPNENGQYAIGTVAYGNEGSGILLFPGTYSSITFTTPDSEGYYAITVGEPTPEPETLSLFGLGLLALPLLRASLARRRRA